MAMRGTLKPKEIKSWSYHIGDLPKATFVDEARYGKAKGGSITVLPDSMRANAYVITCTIPGTGVGLSGPNAQLPMSGNGIGGAVVSPQSNSQSPNAQIVNFDQAPQQLQQMQPQQQSQPQLKAQQPQPRAQPAARPQPRQQPMPQLMPMPQMMPPQFGQHTNSYYSSTTYSTSNGAESQDDRDAQEDSFQDNEEENQAQEDENENDASAQAQQAQSTDEIDAQDAFEMQLNHEHEQPEKKKWHHRLTHIFRRKHKHEAQE